MSDSANQVQYVKGKPLVSICCITYNHEPYIRDCLEGFMMQKTNFPFEVLIHDDASTDHTADIIREYEAKYPDIIKPIYQTENQYSKVISISAIYNFPRAQGKYIALCEGDDFWTDPNKLQIQFDFMESHSDYSMCACGGYILDDINGYYYKTGYPVTPFPSNPFDAQTRIILGDKTLQTRAVFLRTELLFKRMSLLIRDTKGMPFGDAQLFMHLSQEGKVGYIYRRMCTYRIRRGSISQYENPYRFENNITECFKTICINNNREDLIPLLASRLHKETYIGFLKRKMAPLKHYFRGDKKRYVLFYSLPSNERVKLTEL